MGFRHLHAGARGLHLEGPDAGRASGTAVVADMEVLGFRFEEACAGMVGQAGRTGRDVGGRRDDEGRLDRILQFPDLLGHPAGKRTLLEADLAVEGVHRLMLHLPARVGALHDVDHAGGVALVGIVVHGEAVAEFVERDLLGIAQAEVEDLEVRAVRLEAEDRAAVMRVVLPAFLGGQVEATVADGAPDAAVVADGEAVHVMPGKRHADAEAFLDDLALRLDAVALGVLQHPELRDAGEVDVVIPGHHPRAGAVEHAVEPVGEDLLRSEGAVGLLAGDTADDLRLGRHPFDGLLGLPLLVQGRTVGRRLGREVVMVPEKVVPVILDAEAEAMRFGDVDAAVVAEGDGGGRGDAGRLVVGGDLEGGPGHEGRAALAGDPHEAGFSLRLRPSSLGEVRLGVARENEVVGGDDAPGADLVVDDPDDAVLALEFGDVPDGLAEGQVVGPRGLAHDLAADEQLDGGLAGMVASGDQEAQVRMGELELRRGQRAGGGVAAMSGTDERVAPVVAELSVDAVELAGDRGEAESSAGRLPAVEAVALEGLDDLGVGLQDGGAQTEGERSEEGGLHGEKRVQPRKGVVPP